MLGSILAERFLLPHTEHKFLSQYVEVSLQLALLLQALLCQQETFHQATGGLQELDGSVVMKKMTKKIYPTS